MNIFFKTVLIATSLLCAGLWLATLSSCTVPICCTPPPAQLAFICTDSVGHNISQEVFNSLEIFCTLNGKTVRLAKLGEMVIAPRPGWQPDVVHGNIYLDTTSQVDTPVILSTLPTLDASEFTFFINNAPSGVLSLKKRTQRHSVVVEEVRWNGRVAAQVPVRPPLSTCYALRVR